jgi:hypothetical protein
MMNHQLQPGVFHPNPPVGWVNINSSLAKGKLTKDNKRNREQYRSFHKFRQLVLL